jgi:hypothetical protein
MYLRHLHVQNVKLLRDVKIDFVGADGQPRMWTVFVGENRSCKTTLLQTIAAAASGRDQAIHLTTDVVSSWPDLRRLHAELSIDAVFELSSSRLMHEPDPDLSLLPPRPLKTHLDLKPDRSVFDGRARFFEVDTGSDPLVAARRENHAGWFIAGYGVRRMLRGVGTIDTQRQRNPSLDWRRVSRSRQRTWKGACSSMRSTCTSTRPGSSG